MDDNGAVLFTCEGKNDAPSAYPSGMLICLLGLYFKLVDQNEQWPQQRYMMYSQPRALPLRDLAGHIVLEGLPTHTVDLLSSLDQLALQYTDKTLRYSTIVFALVLLTGSL